jgi:potassium-transporting ATPase potassium-binding subunit
MLVSNLIQPLVLLVAVIALTPPLGAYMARVMSGERTFLQPLLGPVERVVYRSLRLRPDREQNWKAYARSLLVFSVISIALLYVLQRVQGLLPLNPDGFGAVDPYLALNTAVSFVTKGPGSRPARRPTCSRCGPRST